jgi:hypothetical protein
MVLFQSSPWLSGVIGCYGYENAPGIVRATDYSYVVNKATHAVTHDISGTEATTTSASGRKYMISPHMQFIVDGSTNRSSHANFPVCAAI